jgi:ubiquinone biosynthesis protein UbiJ
LFFDLLLSPVASIINRGIDDNDDAQNLCDALDGRSLRIVAKPLPKPILISAADGMVDVSSDTQKQADAEISGTVIELNRLMFIDSHAPIREGHVEITGDVEIADRFRELLLCARPDLEEELADWFGASLASQLSSFTRDTRTWAADLAEDLTDRATDYLHEDAGQLPAHNEINSHFAAVDELVNDVERLQTRLDRLTEKQST